MKKTGWMKNIPIMVLLTLSLALYLRQRFIQEEFESRIEVTQKIQWVLRLDAREMLPDQGWVMWGGTTPWNEGVFDSLYEAQKKLEEEQKRSPRLHNIMLFPRMVKAYAFRPISTEEGVTVQ